MNNNKNSNNKRLLSFVASGILLSSCFSFYSLNNYVLANDENLSFDDYTLNSDALENLLEKIEKEKKDKLILEEESKNLENTIEELKEELSNVENKINYFEEYLFNKQFEIEDLNLILSELVNETEKNKIYLEEHQIDFKSRLNTIYKQYNKNDLMILEVLINSEGFFDMVSNLNVYKNIVSKDNTEVVEYIEIIENYEKNQKETSDLLGDMTMKIKEYENLIEDLNVVLLEKLKTEDSLNLALTNKKSEIVNAESNLSELENRFSLEKERLFERLLAEKESKKLSNESKNAVSNESKNTVSNSNLNLEGDKDFDEYQKSINWARNKYGADVFQNYYNIIDKYSKEYGVPSWLIKGIIMTESSFNKDTSNVNSNGTIDRGLMQMNSNTAPGVANRVGLNYFVGIEFIPENNIKMGSYYISAKLKETGSDYHKGLTSYNRGSTGAKRFYEKNGSYESSYSKKVLGYGEVFKKEEENL